MAEQGPSAADAKQALNMLETMKSKLGGVLQQIGGARKKLKRRRKSRRKSRKKKSHKKRGSKKRRKSRRKRKTKRRRR
jgi:hypothetical protein